MNAGIDIKAAFGEATAHEDTRQTHFYGVVQCDPHPRSVSAPGLTADNPVVDVPHGPKSGKSSGSVVTVDAETETARNKAKKARQKASKAAKAAAAPPPAATGVRAKTKVKALGNGGVGDGGAGATGGKGKGKGKLLTHTSDTNLEICYKYNQGKPCAQTPCPRQHVCRKCEGPHPFAECPKKNA